MNSERPKFNLEGYSPKAIEDVIYFHCDLPPRDFSGDKVAICHSSILKTGIILLNIFHRDYPEAISQAQIFLREGKYHVFYAHSNESDIFIPYEITENIVQEAIPETIDRIQSSVFSLLLNQN
jgi:hypothetical protein